ncbi:MAG: sigma 54-interacting transcriptional regulator [Clostridiaceae bacterium]|nr:sigma 54-interacting transcriptional regulator [Clostridiaceae bacterium]
MKIIAGTGQYEKKVNQNVSDEGHIYKMVIETGTRKIIDNPREHEICLNCPSRSNCTETFDMSAPIKLNDSVIGVIGFVCNTESQKAHILENYNTFIDFLDQITDLIVLKALETKEQERNLEVINLLNEIFENVEEGVIVLNKNKNISKINEKAKQILGMEIENHNSLNIQIRPTGSELLDLMEYHVLVNNTVANVIGREYNISSCDYNKVFMFKDQESLREAALELTMTNEKFSLSNIIGESKEIQILNHKLRRMASSYSTVLMTGESGTGKELYARALHDISKQSRGPFIAVNCAAIPENLLESELFGYVKGAFTGADPKGKIGKFELANNGTIFLDEIGDMPLYIQAKLLRVLEQKEIIRLGANNRIKINARVIAATNKDLDEMVSNHSFREDLYYRLNVIPIYIPPLRERGSDIKLLTNYFIDKFSRLFNKNVVSISHDFWEAINKYNWPGNVRELQNTIEYAINMMGDTGHINNELLPEKVKRSDKSLKYDNFTIENMERELFKKAIEIYGSDGESKKVIAEKLGIGIATLYRKLKKYNLKI